LSQGTILIGNKLRIFGFSHGITNRCIE
jgi:hypothetical protein